MVAASTAHTKHNTIQDKTKTNKTQRQNLIENGPVGTISYQSPKTLSNHPCGMLEEAPRWYNRVPVTHMLLAQPYSKHKCTYSAQNAQSGHLIPRRAQEQATFYLYVAAQNAMS